MTDAIEFNAENIRNITPEQLIAALKSGKYKKHKGQLRDNDRKNYCCLGVLCDLGGAKFLRDYRAADLDNGQVLTSNSDVPEPWAPSWLYESVSDYDADIDGYDDVQQRLILLNDSCRGWGEVIAFLELIVAERARLTAITGVAA